MELFDNINKPLINDIKKCISSEAAFTCTIFALTYLMEKKRQNYASDLTDAQWAVVRPLLKGLKPGTWPKRELLDAVFILLA